VSKQVYLAGPITGLCYGDCTDWRKFAEASFEVSGIKGLSPMRAKEHLKDKGVLTAVIDSKHMNPMSTHKAIVSRDRFDCTRCDVLLVNLLDAKTVSIGTMMEIAWADLSRIPIVCAIEDSGNVHEHGFIQELINFRVNTLEKAISIVKAILL
jgi:nucleoside 2-deoxyribosyltransferase